MIISQSNCPPPPECAANWNPNPCTSCQIDCGPCTIYTYCGNAANGTECILFVACAEESAVKVTGTIGGETQSFFQSGVEANCLFATGHAIFVTDNGPVKYQGYLDIEIKNMKGEVICRKSEYYNCN